MMEFSTYWDEVGIVDKLTFKIEHDQTIDFAHGRLDCNLGKVLYSVIIVKLQSNIVLLSVTANLKEIFSYQYAFSQSQRHLFSLSPDFSEIGIFKDVLYRIHLLCFWNKTIATYQRTFLYYPEIYVIWDLSSRLNMYLQHRLPFLRTCSSFASGIFWQKSQNLRNRDARYNLTIEMQHDSNRWILFL